MGFEITSKQSLDKMYEGQIISYKVSPVMRIKTDWVTEITHVKEQQYFVDEQRVGPYGMWHHEHILIERDGGVFMEDIITYKLPFGWLGDLIHRPFILPKLKEIFAYRRIALDKIFNT